MAGSQFLQFGPLVPTRGWRIGRSFGRLIMRTAGWSFQGEAPNTPKAVLAVAPHSSNWDFIVGVVAMLALDLDARFLGKHTLFKGPLGIFMRWLGGIPVDRNHPRGVVDQVGDLFRSSDQMILALAPEGTRSAVTGWKTGFHRIAVAADVPIIAIAFDYETGEIRFRPSFTPTDDVEADVAELQRFCSGARGRRPDQS